MPRRVRPTDPALRKELRRVLDNNSYRTIREYAEALITAVHRRDADGRAIGFDYAYIREQVLVKFPTVTFTNVHKGKQTKMPFKELQEFACELNRCGVKLPFRPRRKQTKKDSDAKKDTGTVRSGVALQPHAKGPRT